MRACLVAPLVLIFSMVFCGSAHAAGIVDLQFVGEGHTIEFSISDSAIIADHPHYVGLQESAPATIDGVSGYTVSGTYYIQRFPNPNIVLQVPPSLHGGNLFFNGPFVVASTVIPISDPTPSHPDDLLVTFIPGTYDLVLTSGFPSGYAIAPYTLTINEESQAVPEPASLVLLVTGLVGVGGTIRKRPA